LPLLPVLLPAFVESQRAERRQGIAGLFAPLHAPPLLPPRDNAIIGLLTQSVANVTPLPSALSVVGDPLHPCGEVGAERLHRLGIGRLRSVVSDEAGNRYLVALSLKVQAALEGCAIVERHAVQSSNLGEVGYDPESRTLEVVFRNGGTYQYYGVPDRLFRALLEAPSKGSFLHARIKSSFQYKRVR